MKSIEFLPFSALSIEEGKRNERKILTNHQKTKIADVWTEAKREKKVLFNGRLVAGVNFSLRGKTFGITVVESDFKEFLGLKDERPETFLNGESFNTKVPIQVTGGAILQTADNFILTSMRSEKSFVYPGMLSMPPEGHWNPRTHRNKKGKLSYHNMITEELSEELGLDFNKISKEELQIIGGVYDKMERNVYIASVIQSFLKKNELEKQMHLAPDELKTMQFIKIKDAAKMLEKKKLTPCNQGKLALFLNQEGYN